MYTARGSKNRHNNLFGIDVTNHAIKCLGVFIGHDKDDCYNMNWEKSINDMEKLFESWKKKINLIWKNMHNQYFGNV